MAKNNMITRRGTSLNLSTGKGIKTANILWSGDVLSDEDEAMYDENTDAFNSGFVAEQAALRKAKQEKLYGKIGAGLSAGVSILNDVQRSANAYDTSKYDNEAATVDDAISIGNFDSLSDWRMRMPLLDTNIKASDLDTTTGAQKGIGVLSSIGTGASTGAQIGGLYGAIIGGGIAGVASGIGLKKGQTNRENEAKKLNLSNKIINYRINGMYNHELNDIQEENSLKALANISFAKGGKIHIAPSKRGTFKAQAKRMGMSVQQAAAHILAHKDRYSPAMRRKANFAKNFAHAYGGELFADGGMFEHPAEYNHGGFFSLDPELIKINQGGTHEMNPLNGVPMGFDENGIPNLVEEGETIFDDYVFSNRLAPTENQLAEGGLPTKYKNHTFADISAKIGKQFEETPNDEISKESMKEYMQRLKTIQEQVKEDKEAEEQVNAASDFAFAPEAEQQQMLSQETPTNIPTETPTEIPTEVPQDMMQEVPAGMEAYNNAPVDMMALGGNLFTPGGYLDEEDTEGKYILDSRVNRFIIINKDGNPVIDYDKVAKIAEARAARRAEKGSEAYQNIFKQELEQLTKRVESQAQGILNEDWSPSAERQERRTKATEYLRSKGYKSPSHLDKEAQKAYQDILDGKANFVNGKVTYQEGSIQQDEKGIQEQVSSLIDAPQAHLEELGEGEIIGPVITKRDTSGVAGTVDKRRYNTTEDIAGLTAEQKRDAWFNSSGKSLIESLNEAKKGWDTKGLKGDELKKEQQAYVDAMNAVQEAYAKAYEAGYDPKTKTANKDAAVKALQELWNQHKGNKYFESLMPKVVTKGITGDNQDQGWQDDLWGAITSYRNWGLNEYFDSLADLASKGDKNAQQLLGSLKNAGISYTPSIPYGNRGYSAYKFGLLSDREPFEMSISDKAKEALTPDYDPGLIAPDVTLTPEQERLKRKTDRQLARQERRDARAANDDGSLPTWMRYAPVVGAGLSAIWDMAQKPDYSVAEAVENAARNVPRARFNPIGNYLTYRPLDRNYYLNQVRNQGLATDRAILNSAGANQGAATAALLASQYNTQNNIGNSLMQQELANRQNEQQVAQFNRGTDQYNSQGLFNESIYNQRAGMQKSQMGITAAQLRQAERQRRNAAISADLTNLFQGIGDIGWENMNINMVNSNRANIGYGINKRGKVGYTTNAKNGGMLTKKSRRK